MLSVLALPIKNTKITVLPKELKTCKTFQPASKSHPEIKDDRSILIHSSGIILPGVVVQFAPTDLHAHNGNRAETMAETEN